MKVEINQHICTIGWNYESKIINKACGKLKISKESFKGLNKKKIAEKLGLNTYPLPDSTHCIITDTVTGDIFTGTVTRFHKDPWSREQARKRALTKALKQLFPETMNKEQSKQRKKFWDAYHNRIQHNPELTIQKCIKKGFFTLQDVANYANKHHTITFVKQEAFSVH